MCLNNIKCKNVSSEEERPAKQQKIQDCAYAKVNRNDSRHVRITNSIASMICIDAIPTNVEGFKNLMSTVLQSAGLQCIFLFSYSKLKNAVSSFQQEKTFYSYINRIYSTLLADYIREFHSP